jgi:predicted regulator of Ras-like GTPase activity (Roadblock/LC7/MglB family)
MKLFNLVKGLFGRPAAEPAPVENYADESAATEGLEQAGSESQPSDTTSSFANAFAAAHAEPTPTATVDVANSEILLPLSSLVAALPVELQQRVLMDRVGEVSIAFPLDKITAQLSQGLVRVTFGEIRQAEPVAFSGGADRDYMMVTLPLAELVSRLGPAMLAVKSRKPAEIPEEITSPFGLRGEGLAISKTPGAPSTPGTSFATRPRGAQSVAPVPPPAADPRARGNVSSIPKPAAPGALPGTSFYNRTAPAAPITPARPVTPGNGNSLPPGKAPVSKPPVGNVPMGGIAMPASPAPEKPANGSNGSNGHGSHAAPAPAPAPVSPFNIAFSMIEEALPQELRLEAAQMDLADAKLSLPMDQVADGVKRGRIAFTWKQLRGWMVPAVAPAVSAHDGLTVILPLAVIAPIFMSRHKQQGTTQKRVIVDQKIPNLFFGFPQPEAPAAPVAETPVAIPVVPAPKPADTNYFVFDDDADQPMAQAEPEAVAKIVKPAAAPGTTFASRKATPNEVVMKASLLEGVYGALVVLPDGLLVAAKLDPALNGETVAALIPQMYSKLSGCTKELRMGELNNLNFTVGKVPWKIFRVNGIFFAAFGCAGEPLPTGHLAELAAELDYKKTQ